MPDKEQPDLLELSYCAGLFDGEGSAGVYIFKKKTSKRYRLAVPQVQLKMTDAEPVRAMQRAFGGCFNTSEVPSRKLRGYTKPVYIWNATHRNALRTAIALIPWCKNIKKLAQLQSIVDHYDAWKPARRGEHRYPIANEAQVELFSCHPKDPT